MVCLECKNVSVGYERPGVAQDISFRVETGDYLCLVGENGAGKSTLIKTILGFIKPLSGEIERHFRFSELGYLPQQTVVQRDFPATVEEIVLSGCQASMRFPFYRKAEKTRALNAMERLGVSSFAKRSFKELSGGQKQRVLLSRALCSSKNLLVLDEPVSGLDREAVSDFYSFIKEFNKDGMTVIMITHDLAAMKASRHILSLGKHRFFGTTEDFFKTVEPQEEKADA